MTRAVFEANDVVPIQKKKEKVYLVTLKRLVKNKLAVAGLVIICLQIAIDRKSVV